VIPVDVRGPARKPTEAPHAAAELVGQRM